MTSACLETIATRLRQVMVERSITQLEMSRIAGVTQGAVSRWLINSKPTKSRVKRIAIHLDLNEVWLWTGEGSKELTLTERLSRNKFEAERSAKVRGLIASDITGGRVIYIQEQSGQTPRPLRFDSASDEHWVWIIKLIEENYLKATENIPNSHDLL